MTAVTVQVIEAAAQIVEAITPGPPPTVEVLSTQPPSVVEVSQPGPPGPATTNEKSFAVTAPDTDVKFAFRVPLGGVVSRIASVVQGVAPSVTFSLRHGPDVSGAGVELVTGGVECSNTTTGLVTTAIDAPIVAPGSWMWLTVSAVGGVADSLSVTVEF